MTKKRVEKRKPKSTSKSASSKAIKKEAKSGIIPLHDRVLVKTIDAEELNKTASGIIIPDTVSKEKPEQGIVIAVGEGRWDDGVKVPMSVEVGDKIVFSKYGYDEIKVDGVEYYILKEDQILAIIRN
jgi:chaperonin GroES